jgi:hypothetical protein
MPHRFAAGLSLSALLRSQNNLFFLLSFKAQLMLKELGFAFAKYESSSDLLLGTTWVRSLKAPPNPRNPIRF